ncbi:MAG: PSD1 and planctomycete cytochrome C domain-containing protein [Planctomycetota bacterium]|nr:PSD1 and planctomycete cytochrome C domain-containing protein [Planctomycetota bacterium]
MFVSTGGLRRRTAFATSVAILLALASCFQPFCAASEEARERMPVPTGEEAEKLFTLRVLPILKARCFVCHGQDAGDVRGDYDLLTREGMIAGGESGEPALVPGKPEASPLYRAILWKDLEMPPKENDRLQADEIESIRAWIVAGAPWPDREKQRQIQQAEWAVRENSDGIIVDTSGGLAEDWTYRRYRKEDLWAFQPLVAPQLPNQGATGHPVDAFIERKLRQVELRPARQAGYGVLIRRASYDLTGLPPTPREVFEFGKAWKKDPQAAWKDLIERLLSSSHYGERWAQHWLDVARYADTAGFSNDYERSNAWRYRDYVIRAFNEDKPYNEFVMEQIAGDELRPGDPESLIATGFLRMGPWGTAMVPQPEARQIYLDDLVHNVGQTFLSMPMRCCKCHDHKFDPLPTRDYYRMYATFATTQPAEMKADFLPQENRKGFVQKKQLVEELLDYARSKRAEVYDKQEAAAREWYAKHNLPYKDENARRKDPEDQKPPRHVGLTPEEKGVKKVREQDVWIWERRMERFQPMAQAVYNGQDGFKNGRKLRTPKNINRKWRPSTFILGGGSLEAQLDPAHPGVLSAAGISAAKINKAGDSNQGSKPGKGTDRFGITRDLVGRRLEFARWMVDPQNPLTARSFVNRVWQYHFGKGIVKTANNFGAKGSKPSHPELLDWLTADFVRNGWKVKRLHRLIMTSATYRRSSRSVDLKVEQQKDPDRRWLATFPARRITAEELRDSLLQISGELNRETGGLPIMPEINMEVALQPRMIQFSIAPAHQPSRTPWERNRRTIYAYRVRGQADPFLEIMNQPNPNESCEIRNAYSVTPQAFTLLNSDVMTDRSIAFALRVMKEKPDNPQGWIERAVHLAFCRNPTPGEMKNLAAYLEEMRIYHREHPPAPKKYPTSVERSLVEELTGKPFVFIEKLNVFEDYVPDAKPWTVDADTRAMADICLLLFNSNEMLFVY